MTFTDMCDTNNAACETSIEKRSLTIGHALERCLMKAVADHRVTVGIEECAKLLGCAPERVMLCIIPDMAASPDVSMHIQHTLVRSFCWENDIRLLAVKNCDKLQSILHCARHAATQDMTVSSGSPAVLPPTSSPLEPTSETETSPVVGATTTTTMTITPNNNNNNNNNVPSCILVEAPSKGGLSAVEDFVCDYHDTVMFSDIFPKPVIQLPV